eukprot:m.247628 g.247628  ORF g.247628 m.247628 type:complete len:162 (-) comp26455_c1_seq4:2931-3416(-)
MAGLVKFNRLHEQQYASDKLVKTVGFAAGFVAAMRQRVGWHGPDDPVALGLQQIASQCGNVGYALRFHGGYSGLLNELENFVNISFLGGWKDPWLKVLVRLQSAALMQCEHPPPCHRSPRPPPDQGALPSRVTLPSPSCGATTAVGPLRVRVAEVRRSPST